MVAPASNGGGSGGVGGGGAGRWPKKICSEPSISNKARLQPEIAHLIDIVRVASPTLQLCRIPAVGHVSALPGPVLQSHVVVIGDE